MNNAKIARRFFCELCRLSMTRSLCGISTQLQQQVAGFDEVVTQQDADFTASGLVADSLIRLGFLALIPRRQIIGRSVQ